MNLTKKTFYGNSTWTAPAGVKTIKLHSKLGQNYLASSNNNTQPFHSGGNAQILDSQNTQWAWGLNSVGQLGINSITNASSPTQIVGGLNFSVLLSSSPNSNFGVTTTGQIWGWGLNLGILGNNATANASSPVQVVGGLRFQRNLDAIAFNDNLLSVLAISEQGDIWAWGNNAVGYLGNNTTTNASSPVQVVGGIKFKKVVAASTNVMGLDVNGNIWAWGQNGVGQLGNGTTNNASSPVLVLGGLKFQDMQSPYDFSGIALDTNGNIWGWGSNTFGQLGNGTTNNASSPVLVLGGLKFKQFSVDNSLDVEQATIAAVDINGNAWCWGGGNAGQLGNNTTNRASSPVLVVGGLTFAAVACGSCSGFSGGQQYCGGLTTGGQLWMWGSNLLGALGNNSTTSTSAPVQVAGSMTFSKLSFGTGTNYAINQNGDLFAWGYGLNGRLGNNTASNASSPVLVLGGFKFRQSNPPYTQTMTVIPGQTYTINFAYPYIAFGMALLPYASELVIDYE